MEIDLHAEVRQSLWLLGFTAVTTVVAVGLGLIAASLG